MCYLQTLNTYALTATLLLFSFFSLSQTPGNSYCGPYTSSAPLVLSNIQDSVISGLEITNPSGHCIDLDNCSNIIIENCLLRNASGNGVDIYQGTNIIIRNCRMDSIATGVYAQSGTMIKVVNNYVRNVLGPFPRGQMAQFNNVSGASSKINDNILENILGESYPEDAINLYQCNGDENDPIQVIGNWIRGGGPSPSGGGIMTGDAGGSYIIAQNNVLVDPGQYGVAIASGENIQLLDNQVYGKQQDFTNVGIYVWNQYNPTCANHTVSGNAVHWTNNNGVANHNWDGANCGTITGWNDNTWGAAIDSTILPEILDYCETFVTDIHDIQSELINAYPNPVSNQLTLGSIMSWAIYSTDGALLKSGNSDTIEVGDLPVGSYLLKSEKINQLFVVE